MMVFNLPMKTHLLLILTALIATISYTLMTLTPSTKIYQDACAAITPMSIKTPIGALTIAEILPNPLGKDTDQEWIKILNQSAETIDLHDFVLNINHELYRLPSILLTSKNSKIFFSKELKFSFPNNKSTVSLETITGQIADQMSYPEPQQNKIYTH